MGLRLIFTFALCTAITKETETQTKCALIQKKEIIHILSGAPSFLRNANKTYCQVTTGRFRDKGLMAVNNNHPKTNFGLLQCRNTDIYIKPECVCSFYSVFNAPLYHEHSSCPEGTESDIVTRLTCKDCKKYSLNNSGPCINGGKLTCKGEEVAPNVTCECPPNYSGAFCENKVENITRICVRISNSSLFKLENCNSTWGECDTYSGNQQYVYRCQEANASQDGKGLSLCQDTENTTPETTSLGPNQNEPEKLNTLRTGPLYFLLYLVSVVISFLISYFLHRIFQYNVCKNYLQKTYEI